MAVLTDFPGLEVNVVVNGEVLDEYDDGKGQDQHKTATRYIEASSGANFEVRYRFAAPLPFKYGVRASMSVDGVPMSQMIRPNNRLDGAKWLQYACWHGKKAKLRFSELKVVEHGDSSLSKDRLDKLGTIVVQFEFVDCHVSARSPVPPVHRSTGPKPNDSTIDTVRAKESAVSALSHFTSLDPPETRPVRQKHLTCTLAKPDPFATFVFAYRSRSALEILHIIPRASNANAANAANGYRSKVENPEPPSTQVDVQNIKQEGVKREREADATVGMDDDDDVIIVEERRRKRVCLATEDDEVIVLD